MLLNRIPGTRASGFSLFKQLSISLSIAAGANCCALANANITGASWDYGTGSIWCDDVYDSASPDLLTIYGTQTGPTGGMSGWVTTDSPGDPSLTLAHSINNDSGQNWTAYVVDVFMGVDFSFSGYTASNPAGWAGQVAIAPQQVSPNQWMGELVYSENGGPPVNSTSGDPNNVLDFSYTVTFSGSTLYTITEQVTAVPEPGSPSLFVAGGCLLAAGTVAGRKTQLQSRAAS